jgi:quercetin dioxygenase-like cupin family protein
MTPKDTLPIAWNTIPWEQVREGVQRKLCNGTHATMALHRVSASAVTTEHSHPEEQFVYVVSGQLDYSIEDKHYVMHAGDVLRVPGGVMHRSKTVGDTPAVTLDVFSPRRDY